jgi:YHS domain-containing protein
MGHWEKLNLPWYETNYINCEFCGMMLTGDIWIAEINGKRALFCNPHCEETFRRYWLPKYGKGGKSGKKPTSSEPSADITQ